MTTIELDTLLVATHRVNNPGPRVVHGPATFMCGGWDSPEPRAELAEGHVGLFSSFGDDYVCATLRVFRNNHDAISWLRSRPKIGISQEGSEYGPYDPSCRAEALIALGVPKEEAAREWAALQHQTRPEFSEEALLKYYGVKEACS